MMEHQRQIVRLLPGGLHIVGVSNVTSAGANESKYRVLHSSLQAFFITSQDVFQSNVGMTHVRKLDSGLQQTEDGRRRPSDTFVILHLDPSRRMVVPKIIDRANQGLKSTDLKTAGVKIKWQKVEGTVLLDVPFVFNEEESGRLLLEKIDFAVKPLEQCIENALILFDQSFRAGDEFLDLTVQEQSRSKGKTWKLMMTMVYLALH